ncbi:MAG: pyridoxal 5'-phosphate synthase glutaminase subunit PdxT [Thermoplasmata archaeon]
MKIGILGIQGDVAEHFAMAETALIDLNMKGTVSIVKTLKDLDVEGLIIPGGESTTITKFLIKERLFDKIIERVNAGSLHLMGTCAGAIVMSDSVIDSSIKPMHIIPMAVSRNAYGRQVDSFEVNINIKSFESPFKAIFIRAPKILNVSDTVDILAKSGSEILFVRYNNNFALTFHPELSGDSRIHKLFISGLE